MGLSAKLLGTGERELLHLHTHWKTMIGPALVFLGLAVLGGFGLAILPPSWQPWAGWVMVVLLLGLAIPFCLLPLLRWRTTSYTITNHRLITRHGIITKAGHDIPLQRISNVAYERTLTDRIFGCGTLVFTTSADEPVTLTDVPDVENVGVRVSNLLFTSNPQVSES
ncbi:MAG: PH domain-containing protein [Micropruina sp.]|nr:MAG: PH domain-containing protein [Micropruina sp.]